MAKERRLVMNRSSIVPLLAYVWRGADRVVRKWQVNRTAAALENLSDELLRDIGVARDEIPKIALGVTERVPRTSARFIARRNARKEVTA
jgi:uncharacterized protein YjiS (DUF1127 family)